MKYITILFLFLTLIADAPCMGKVVNCDLKEMTDTAKLIIIGWVTGVVEAGKNKPGHEDVATINIRDIIKGDYTGTNIEITYWRDFEPPGLSIGEWYLLFVSQRADATYFIVQSYAGTIPIKGDRVKVRNILNQQEDQNLEEFIANIRNKMRVGLGTGDIHN